MEREFLYLLKVSPPKNAANLKESPFLVTRSIKNRSTLVLYKVMIKKGVQKQKDESTLLNQENSTMFDSIEVQNGQELFGAKNKLDKKKGKINNNTFAQANQINQFNLSSPTGLK